MELARCFHSTTIQLFQNIKENEFSHFMNPVQKAKHVSSAVLKLMLNTMIVL